MYNWFWCGIQACFAALKAVFDEKSLFPEEIRDHEQKAMQLREPCAADGEIRSK